MRRHRRFERAFFAVLILLGAGGTFVAADDDPLSRTAFDREISGEMNGASVVEVFSHIARTVKAGFVLDFENDPSLTLSFKATNLSARSLLRSIGETYGLQYAEGRGHVIVRRKGWAASPVHLEVAPKDAAPGYRLKLQVRSADGNVLSSPHVTTGLNQVAEIKQGPVAGAEPYFLLKVCPRKETSAGLELLVEGSERRTVPPNRTVIEEERRTIAAGKDETLLFRGSNGHQFVLTGWEVLQKAATAAR